MKALGNWKLSVFAGFLAISSLACPKPEPAVDPSISSFTVSPTAITEGESGTLAWETLHAVTISIVDGAGNSVDVSAANVASGSVSVSPTVDSEYTLTAVGGEGTTPATATAKVTVSPAEVCGDGIKTASEVCDDGNTLDGDYCSADCATETGSCGDSTIQGNELCDDGNTLDGDYCSADCKAETGSCGDGLVQSNEACDDANQVEPDYCSNDCQVATGACGDGVVESFEACDDSNTIDGDYCSADCTNVTGSCGDSAVQDNELCDDGNTVDGDYCSADCMGIIGACGDNTVQINETCDDGNTIDTDYCSADCMNVVGSCGDTLTQSNEACDDGNLVDGDYCAGDCSAIIGSCGDTLTQINETCDDGNTIDGDYCSADCMNVTGSCGDAAIQSNEACDDGNTMDGDYCSADCLTVSGFCGDGIPQTNEACDDGNTILGDGCDNSCGLEGVSCVAAYDLNAYGAVGDGTFSWSSDTSLFAANFNASCSASGNNPEAFAAFTAPADGTYFIDQVSPTWDSVIWTWDAACDPTSAELSCTDNGGKGGESVSLTLIAGQQIFIVVDGWSNFSTNAGAFTLTVSPELCGDGILVNAEVCDDGNTTPGDGCDATCALEAGYVCPTAGALCRAITCGDGFVDAPETCDDTNTTPGDGCDATCALEAGYVCPTAGAACRPIVCGDGFVDAPETCDDMNATPGDGCDATCTLEAGYVCPAAGAACRAIVCGDGIVDAPEQCDDSNAVAGDGCGATCMWEGGTCADFYDLNNNGLQNDGSWLWQQDTTNFSADYAASCTSSGNNPDVVAAFVAPSAGAYLVTVDATFNSVLWVWDAACDAVPNDLVCSNASSTLPETGVLSLGAGEAVNIVVDGYGDFTTNEGGFTLTVQEIVCGDSVVTQGVESCDDGNNVGGDGCSASCQVEGGYDCATAGAACTYVCGNSVIDASESCDDGNTASLDGCSAGCQLEAGFTCDMNVLPNTCVSWAVPALVGDLVITEVMQNPDSVFDSEGEWFEVWNPTATDFQLMGITFQDDVSTTEKFTVDLPVGIPAGGYGVFAVNGDSATNGGLPQVDYVFLGGGTSANFTLGNSTDGIKIFAVDGVTEIDTVIWDNGATFPDPTGQSMALMAGLDGVANDTGANWCTGKTKFGMGDMGSPGAPNPAYDCALVYENFETWPPAAWTIIDDNGAGAPDGFTWSQCSQADRVFGGGSGLFACADSDAAGGGVTMNETFVSPVFDVSTATTVTLGFTHYFKSAGSQVGTVEITTDAGVTWTPVVSYSGVSTVNGATESLDISAQAAGQAAVQVRMIFNDGGGWNWYWLIDDFTIMAQ